MTFNSLVLIPAGFTVTERARMLGHSVETNLKHYSFDPRNTEKESLGYIKPKLSIHKTNAGDGAHDIQWMSVLRRPERSEDLEPMGS